MELGGKRQAGSKDVNKDILCDPCELEDDQENAVSYCTNCIEYLCDNCTRVHRKSRTSRHHQLLGGDEMPRRKLKSVEDKFCSKHQGEEMKYFCRSHNVIVCSVCVTIGHVQCGVEYIEDLAKGFDTSKEYRDLRNLLNEIEVLLAENKLKSDKNSEAVEKSYVRLISDIKEFRTEINSTLDVLEKRVTEEAQKIKSDVLKSMESISTQCDEIQATVKDVLSTLETLEKYKHFQQLVISAMKAETKAIEYKSQLDKISQQNEVPEILFRRDEEVLKTVKSCSKLGQLEILAVKERLTEKDIQAAVAITPTFVKNIDVTQKQDNDRYGCLITGSVLMNDRTVILADRFNYSVKVLDLNADTVTSCIRIENRPWDLTSIDSNTLVVTSRRRLTYLRYDGNLTILKHVQMEDGCTCITYNNNKLYVTFTGNQPSVKILNKDGNVLKTFITDEYEQNLFEHPLYITTSGDGQSFYVSDCNKNTVICLNMQGHILGVYSHDDLLGPTGLTVGDNNCIYVAGRDSHNIHMISAQCEHIRILLGENEETQNPWTMLYNNSDGMMYTSHGFGSMYVFSLQK